MKRSLTRREAINAGLRACASTAAASVVTDDGVSFAHDRADWMGVDIRWADRDRRLDLRLAPGSRMRPSARRPIHIRLAGGETRRDIVFTGTPQQIRL